MGRSFYHVGPDSPVDFNPEKPFYHEASDSYFAMIVRGGKYYQRRWHVGFDGTEMNPGYDGTEYKISTRAGGDPEVKAAAVEMLRRAGR